ncbi:hypothetical protein P154DRAFT_572761 [Amniculicola lignicola CBS 123094]|uniref:Uncharacterized protein n=1 Tax=Amniculicola lignicola CBS 123094 TaxID=1392246 RepID=A0A6A5WXX2_9PLEO|nr:hypothetical protein P154DRAFT_572761 [Amniculicola lignicola CBS 123094]
MGRRDSAPPRGPPRATPKEVTHFLGRQKQGQALVPPDAPMTKPASCSTTAISNWQDALRPMWPHDQDFDTEQGWIEAQAGIRSRYRPHDERPYAARHPIADVEQIR